MLEKLWLTHGQGLVMHAQMKAVVCKGAPASWRLRREIGPSKLPPKTSFLKDIPTGGSRSLPASPAVRRRLGKWGTRTWLLYHWEIYVLKLSGGSPKSVLFLSSEENLGKPCMVVDSGEP